MELLQMVLIAVIIAFVFIMILIGIQAYYIFQELRESVRKANRILENAGNISETVSGSIEKVSSLTSGFNAGSALVSIVKGIGFIRKFTRRKGKNDGE